MSGWTIPKRELTIKLEGDFEGAELTCKLDVSIKIFLELQKLSSDASTIVKSYEMFGNNILLNWNFTNEDGSKLPANGKGMLELTPAIAIGILGAWTNQASGNPISSDSELPSGITLEEELTKTETK
tara:strand:+ start:163 stop:543 length:381 start_codon:yes stop_codon:yes gene_type:complete